MGRTKRMGQMRRRLMTGIFCISLFAADLASVVPVWAKGPVAAEQTQENETLDYAKETEESRTQSPDEENTEEDTQTPDEENNGGDTQTPDDGSNEEGAQIPVGEEGKADTESGEDGVTKDTPDDTANEQETPDGEDTSGSDEQPSVSENDPKEPELSVSENDLGEASLQSVAAAAENIASGTYENTTWVIDANGKLTVTGTGEFAVSSSDPKFDPEGLGTPARPRAPWYKYREKIVSAKIQLKGTEDAAYMFYECKNMTSLDLSGFDTSSVTNMSGMFEKCSGLTSLNVSGFDTSSVTNMNDMFFNCCNLSSLDVRRFDTSKVTDMSGMFCNCNGLTSLDVSGFDTSGVEDMEEMFWGCDKLTSLDVSGFDTSKAIRMDNMFSACSGLKSLDVSGFDTSKVVNMTGMFRACSGLKSLDVSNFDTSKVTLMIVMFKECSGLTSLDVSNFDTSNVELIGSMFEGCSSLTSLDVSNFDTSKVTVMDRMFAGCSSLTSLDVGNFDTSKVTMLSNMFEGCNGLKSLDVSGFDTSKVVHIVGMFTGCDALTELDLSGFDLSNLYYHDAVIEMFPKSSEKLVKIYTPYNVSGALSLPNGDWYMSDGTKLEKNVLPQNLDYSVLIQKGKKPAVQPARLTASKKKIVYGVGDTLNTDDLTVTYYGADSSVRKLAADAYTVKTDGIDMNTAGVKTLTVTYTPAGGATLTAEVTITVVKMLTESTLTVTMPTEAASYTYDGQPKTPKPTVSYQAGGMTAVALTEGTDYTVTYRNHISAYEPAAGEGSASGTGTKAAPTVIIKGAGDYSGTVTKTFTIAKAAAPAAKTKEVMAAGCAAAKEGRTIDLKDCFADCGKKNGYEILSVEDAKSIFSKTPVTADIKGGVLTYGTNAAQEGDTASIRIKVSFVNYRDAELTVKITMAAKKEAVISGITMQESFAYSGSPVSYGGEAAVRAADGTDLMGKVTLIYRYSGTMADGTAYPAQSGGTDDAAGSGTEKGNGGTEEAPVNAGNYNLTVSVSADDPDYTGSVVYPFAITKAPAAMKAKDLFVPMQAAQGEGSALIPVEQYQDSFEYDVTGLLNGETLKTGPSYTVTEDEDGTKTVTSIDISKAGIYYIHPSGADAGMNYDLTYRPGILMVSEERVAYTVTFDGMGHSDTVTKAGIRSGSLLELTEAERTPVSKDAGYVFAGWYKDKSFDRKKEWNFETDTVQSDLTLYACWLTEADEGGAGLKLCVQEIPNLTYTGSALKPAVTVYDSDGETLLRSGRDYTVKYYNNINAVKVDENGRPTETGGTAKVVNPGKTNEQCTDVAGKFTKDCPYVMITGKGNYAETIYRNYLILPARIPADVDGKTGAGAAVGVEDTPLASGFTLKYTDQLVVNQTKDQQPFGSMKYKKGMKAGTDFTVTLGAADAEGAFDKDKNPLAAAWKAEGELNVKKQYVLPAIPKGYSGAFTLTVTGKGNYAGTVVRRLYVSDKQKLMKNATITLGKKQKTFACTGEDVLLTPGYYDAEKKTYHKVTAEGEISNTPEANADGMFLVKAGKSGKNGGKSLVWGRDYTIDYAGTNRAAGTATMTLTGKNGYAGKKSVTFKITGTPFSAKTIDVKAYDGTKPDDPQDGAFRSAMPYTGKAVTQNKVMLTTKVTQKNPTAKELVYGEHYTVAYKNNVKKGTATMTFTAKPESGYSGSFQKTFKITAQSLSKERLTITPQAKDGAASGETAGAEAVYCRNGAKLSFTLTNGAGTLLREGTDYTVKYKNNSAVTTAQTAENKKPLMTVTGKGNYTGKVEIPFTVVQASLAAALDEGIVRVSCAQVQKKNGMKLKDLKFKLVEGKKTLGVGETKDYVIDETKCTPEMMAAYAEALAAGTTLPEEPVVTVTGKGSYAGEKTIALGQYLYAEKLAANNTYVVVSEGAGQSVYTGGRVTPEVAVYYGEKAAVSAAKKDKVKDEAALTKPDGNYQLKKLTQKPSENAGNAKDGDYTVSYGANIAAGKNKGSVTVTGAGRYGGSVTVKFEIGKKAIY